MRYDVEDIKRMERESNRLIRKMRYAEAEKYLEGATREYEAGIPKMRLAPDAIAKPWYEYSVALKTAAGDLGHHQLVLDLYRRHATYSAGAADRFLAGVASFNLGRMERAASYWRKVRRQFADDYAYVAQAVEMGVVPPFVLEYRVPDLSVGPSIFRTGAGRMFVAHFLLTGQAPEGDIGTAGDSLKLAVDADPEWGLQFAKNILKYPAVSKTVKTAALSTLVENGVYEKGQPVDVVDEHGREMRMSVETSVVTMEVDEHDREIIGRAAELGRAGRYDEAIEILSEAAESDEVSFRVLLCLASLYIDKGDLVQAHDLLSMLSAIEPDVPALLFGLAGYHVKSGDYDEAIRYLNRIDVSRASPPLRRDIAKLREELESSSQ